jgi:hypothetical protein
MRAKTSPMCTFSKREKVNRTLYHWKNLEEKTKKSKVVIIYRDKPEMGIGHGERYFLLYFRINNT